MAESTEAVLQHGPGKATRTSWTVCRPRCRFLSSNIAEKVSMSFVLSSVCLERVHHTLTRGARSILSLGSARPPPKTHVRATCFSRGPHGEWGNNSSAFDLGHHPSFQACHSYQENRGPDGILRFSAPACCHRRQIAVLAVETMPRRHTIRVCPTRLVHLVARPSGIESLE